MIRAVCVALFAALTFANTAARAEEEVAYGIAAQSVDALDREELQAFAERTLAALDDDGSLPSRMNRANAEISAGRYGQAAGTIADVRAVLGAGGDNWLPFELYAQARSAAAETGASFEDAYAQAYRAHVSSLDDVAAVQTYTRFWADLDRARSDVDRLLGQNTGADVLPLRDALRLAGSWAFLESFEAILEPSGALIAEDQAARFIVDENVLIETPYGVTLSAILARPKDATEPLPTALTFTIYTDVPGNRETAALGAAHGYAGIVVDARGKRLSTDDIVPYEVEATDTYAAIDWVVAQPWSDGQVGMIGGSYEGFTAWAATKRLHPALRTIATSAAAIPGFGLPMENNVFLNANYGWAFYVTNNRLLDYSQNDGARWAARNDAWFASGRPYREIDQINDGPANPWLQRWLDHPDYDAYWQAMVPYGEDFADIDIPILTITGYYDDGQISALQYTRDHYRHNPDAEHYVVIGPYDHFGSHQAVKARVLRGYQIDPAAQFSTPGLEYAWLDHVMRGAPKPAMLQDRINFEVMGADRWESAPSLEAMTDERWTFYLTGASADGRRLLSLEQPGEPGAIEQVVDFTDRTTTDAGYYPDPLVDAAPDFSRGLVFETEPFSEPVELSGSFSGMLNVTINKRDFDFMVSLTELKADGSAMPLSYYVGRASYVDDIAQRRLLTPGERTELRFDRTRVVSRRIEAGSRLVVVLDVVKNGFHQVNYGTGGDVSAESIADAGEPLVVQWGTDSFVSIPIRRVAE